MHFCQFFLNLFFLNRIVNERKRSVDSNIREKKQHIRRDHSDEVITNTIREMIADKRFEEEMRITESSLSRQLGVSRTPVRTALKILHSEGLLVKLEGRGYLTKQLSSDAPHQVAETRGVLEGLAAQQLARAGLSALNRDRLNKSIEATGSIINRGLVDDDAIEAFSVANLIFHRTIMRGCDNPFIEDCLQRLKAVPNENTWEVVGSNQVRWSLNRIIVSHSQHLIIKHAIEAGDGARAFNMMREHSGDQTKFQKLF